MKTIKIAGATLLFALLLLSTASCFDVVTGGNVDKEWPRNNAKNPRHSSTTTIDSVITTDTIK